MYHSTHVSSWTAKDVGTQLIGDTQASVLLGDLSITTNPLRRDAWKAFVSAVEDVDAWMEDNILPEDMDDTTRREHLDAGVVDAQAESALDAARGK